MGDRHIVSDHGGKAIAGDVQDATVLNIRAFPNADIINVSPDDGIEPNAGMVANFDVPDNSSAFLKKDTFANFRIFAQIAADHLNRSRGENRESPNSARREDLSLCEPAPGHP